MILNIGQYISISGIVRCAFTWTSEVWTSFEFSCLSSCWSTEFTRRDWLNLDLNWWEDLKDIDQMGRFWAQLEFVIEVWVLLLSSHLVPIENYFAAWRARLVMTWCSGPNWPITLIDMMKCQNIWINLRAWKRSSPLTSATCFLLRARTVSHQRGRHGEFSPQLRRRRSKRMTATRPILSLSGITCCVWRLVLW